MVVGGRSLGAARQLEVVEADIQGTSTALAPPAFEGPVLCDAVSEAAEGADLRALVEGPHLVSAFAL